MKNFSINLSRFLKWLYPGIKVKRWLVILAVGVIATSIGFSMVLQNSLSRNTGSIVVLAGTILIILGIERLMKSFATAFLPKREKELVDILYKARYLERGIKVAAMGGGTGLSTLLHGLKEYTDNLSAIVTVADDGGSSGRLRDQLNVLPPGDIRNCLVALADSELLMKDLFQFRFGEGSELTGHNFGNLFITAMTKLTGDFEKALEESSKVLAIRGRVIPATLQKITLLARNKDNTQTIGETNISSSSAQIQQISVRPADSKATPQAIKTIKEADVIIYGPGSLYTSVIPNLIINGIMEAILESNAIKIYICNIMTQPGETDGYSAMDHLSAMVRHTDPKLVEYCVVNNGAISEEFLSKYKSENSYPVLNDATKIRQAGYRVIEENIVLAKDYIRHNPQMLAKIIMQLASDIKKGK